MQLQPQKSTRKKRLVRSARRERECLRLSFETRRTKKPSRKVVYHLQYIIKDILCVQVQAVEWSKHTCIQTKSYRKLLALAIGFLDSSKSLWPIDARSEASDDRRAAHTQLRERSDAPPSRRAHFHVHFAAKSALVVRRIVQPRLEALP